ncbi:MAG: DUF2116 family Zn-ribbon domain-containing protein [Thermoplasmata archaeon]
MEPHKHCQVCGKPIPLEETLCSEKCRQEYQELLNKRKKRVYLTYILLAIFLGLLFFQMYM